MVEDTHGEGDLRQLTVADQAVGLETLVLCGSHAREVDAVLRAPIAFLQVAQVIGHHRHVGLPVLLQSQQGSHADGVDASHSHAVEAVDAPFEAALHATGVIVLVVGGVVGLLKAYHAVHAVVRQHLIVLGGERHHLYLEVGEIGLGAVKGLCQVFGSGLGGVLSRHDEEILERSELLDGLVLVLTLVDGEDGARHGVLAVEAAVDAAVGA